MTNKLIGLTLCLSVFFGFLLFSKKKKFSYSSLLIYSFAIFILLIFPPTAFLISRGQTVFFARDYIWICLPVIPITAAMLTDLTDYLKGKSKVIIAFASIISVLFIFILGGAGSVKSNSRYAAEPEITFDSYKSVTPVVDRLAELSESAGGNYLVLATPTLTEYIHMRTGAVKTLYGRDIWDTQVVAYTNDKYDDTTTEFYHWMLYNEMFGCVYYMQNDSITNGLDYSSLNHAELDEGDLYTGGGLRFAKQAKALGINAIVFVIKSNTDTAALSHIEQAMSASHEYIEIDSDVNFGYYILMF